MKIVPPTREGLREAAECIRSGGVVAYPTETVYGLAVDPFSVTALQKLLHIKGRASGNPFLLIVSGPEQLADVTASLSRNARAFAEAFWPGPLSLLFPIAPALPAALTADSPKVSLRCPGCETARALCTAVGHAVTSTSANRSGEPSGRKPADIALTGIDVCIDGGELAKNPPSTVYDPGLGRVLRAGAVSVAALSEVAREAGLEPPDIGALE